MVEELSREIDWAGQWLEKAFVLAFVWRVNLDSMSAPDSRFVHACRRQPVDVTPIWLMRQAARYMPEYRQVRKQHSIIEICKDPELAAAVTVTAAERLGVDAYPSRKCHPAKTCF